MEYFSKVKSITLSRAKKNTLPVFTLLTIVISSCISDQNTETKNTENKIQKFAKGLDKVHEKTRKFDSTMHAFEERMMEAGEWAEEFSSDSISIHRSGSSENDL